MVSASQNRSPARLSVWPAAVEALVEQLHEAERVALRAQLDRDQARFGEAAPIGAAIRDRTIEAGGHGP
jgi:hypothetical protein